MEDKLIKVLLIEDNPLNLDMLTRRLQRKGFEVITAMDGQKGIELARSELPQLILMDMSLPILDGWEATKKLKAEYAAELIGAFSHAMLGIPRKCLIGRVSNGPKLSVTLLRNKRYPWFDAHRKLISSDSRYSPNDNTMAVPPPK